MLKYQCVENVGPGGSWGGRRTWSQVPGHHVRLTDCHFMVPEVLVLSSLFPKAVSESCNPIHCPVARSKASGTNLPGFELLLHCCESPALERAP